jgi:CBS domain containing-hemolysin-like protein
MLEAVILSVTPSYLSSLKDKSPALFKKVNYLKNDIERPLASILTFNTIAHTIGAAGAGAEAQKLWGNEYLALFSAVLTFIILFFSEIIPKSIGAKSWKFFLPWSYFILRPMIALSFPIVWVSTWLSKLIKGNPGPQVTRDEIPALAELGFQSGVLNEREFKSLKTMLKFSNVKLSDILKPANKVSGVKSCLSISEAYREISHNSYSRLIVFGLDQDDVKGYVMRKNILQAYIDEDQGTVADLTKKILILPEKTSGQELFERLLAMKVHIAAVIKEDGTFLGIVTLEDLIENYLGYQIYDESD